MAIEQVIWKVGDKPQRLKEAKLASERELEEMIGLGHNLMSVRSEDLLLRFECESALVFLERIKAERAAAIPVKRNRKSVMLRSSYGI